jgi:hypothetical protein
MFADQKILDLKSEISDKCLLASDPRQSAKSAFIRVLFP